MLPSSGKVGSGVGRTFFFTVKSTESVAPLSSVTFTVCLPVATPFGTWKLIATLPLDWACILPDAVTPPTVTVRSSLALKPLPVRLTESPGDPSTGLSSSILALVLRVVVTAGLVVSPEAPTVWLP